MRVPVRNVSPLIARGGRWAGSAHQRTPAAFRQLRPSAAHGKRASCSRAIDTTGVDWRYVAIPSTARRPEQAPRH